MSEHTKQARLDNWAMFVMSRLQVFFNTTDYCDLTLQFEGNVQLKVHRVIMNACTEYFRLLEQECDMDGDILIMPPDLQADVILPIVNFMYTGILEYQHSIFEKLYQTAELMNMPVLLKFLDAQRVKVKTPRVQQASVGRRAIKTEKLPPNLPGRKLPVWKRKSVPMPVQINPVKPYSPDNRSNLSDTRFDNAPKPTRFEWPDDDMHDIKPFDLLPLDSSFDSISYSSKPLLTQEEEMRSSSNSNVFDDLRQLPSGKVMKTKEVVKENKDKDSYSLNSSMDMEDLKSYVKEQKIRSGLTEFDDDEDIDDPDFIPDNERKRKSSLSPVSIKKAKVSNEKENIVEVRASSTSKVDHSKIISEVFKKYPHLVNKNKNIRLKILPKTKSEPEKSEKVEKTKMKTVTNLQKKIVKSSSQSSTSSLEETKKTRAGEQTWVCTTCSNNGEPVEFVLYYLYRKHMTDTHHKQFDACECKHCGDVYDQPLQMTYHMYMAHTVNPPRSVNFPKCTRCSFVALDKDIMSKHINFHAMNANHVQCANCKLGFSNNQSLKSHMQLAGHNGKNNLSFDCQYCTRQLNSATSLFLHCKTTHADDAKKDGMLSLDDGHLDLVEVGAEKEKNPLELASPTHNTTQQQIDDGAEGNLTSSLGPFDIVVLDDQQQFILQGDSAQETSTQITNQQGYMTLPALQDQSYNIGQADIGSTDELVMVLTDHDYNDGSDDNMINNDNSNIVVLYSHPVDGQQNQFITSQGNIMLNSETGMLEIHNESVPISTQGESIEMIQKEIQSHALGTITTTTAAQKVITTTAEIGDILQDPTQDTPVLDKDKVEGEGVESGTDKKVMAVEQKESGKLIDTIEGIDQTDFGLNSSSIPFGDGTQTDIGEPEPMDIDEDPAKQVLGRQPTPQPEVDTLNTAATVSADPIEDKEVMNEVGTQKDEVKKDCVSPSMTTIQEVPETEVPQDLLEPSAEPTGLPVSSTDIIENNDTVAVGEVEEGLGTNSNDDEYKTCASLSVSEQCPEEPMEVDGLAQSTVAGNLEENVEENIKMSIGESGVNLPVSSETMVEGGEDITSLTTVSSQPVVEPVNDKTTEVESLNKKSEDVVDAVEPEPEPAKLSLESVVPQDGDCNLVEKKLTEIAEKSNQNVEEPLDGVESTPINDETTSSDNLVEIKSIGSTMDEISSLPELGEDEPPVDDNIITAHPVPEGTTPDLPTTNLRAPSPPIMVIETIDEPATKETGNENKKTEGISTLLNDWEDTDSQTSEQGKATTVNKLINDWDDE